MMAQMLIGHMYRLAKERPHWVGYAFCLDVPARSGNYDCFSSFIVNCRLFAPDLLKLQDTATGP